MTSTDKTLLYEIVDAEIIPGRYVGQKQIGQIYEEIGKKVMRDETLKRAMDIDDNNPFYGVGYDSPVNPDCLPDIRVCVKSVVASVLNYA